MTNYYRARADILCFQEVHSDTSIEKIWATEWGGKALFSHGTFNARGVCIFFSNKLPYRISKTVKDAEGRFLLCELENLDDPCKRLTICNLYAPNHDRPLFFTQMFKDSLELAPECIFIGDYNLVMNVSMDKKNSLSNNSKAKAVIDKISDDLSLIDIWRVRNPDKSLFSWM